MVIFGNILPFSLYKADYAAKKWALLMLEWDSKILDFGLQDWTICSTMLKLYLKQSKNFRPLIFNCVLL